jgi:hypothetical protein
MKVILTILILLEAVLLFYAVALPLARSGSYKAIVTKVSADGTTTQMVSESQWMQISPQEMAAARRRYALKPSLAVFSLLAVNTVGILYVLRRLKQKAYPFNTANEG